MQLIRPLEDISSQTDVLLNNLLALNDSLHDFGADRDGVEDGTREVYKGVTGKTLEEEFDGDWKVFNTAWYEILKTARTLAANKAAELNQRWAEDFGYAVDSIDSFRNGGFLSSGRSKAALAKDRKYLNKSEKWERAYAKAHRLRRRRYMVHGGVMYAQGGSLDQVFNFQTWGVTSFRKLIDAKKFTGKYKSIENAGRFNRVKYNRMDAAQQQDYFDRLNKKKTVYNLQNPDGSSVEASKEVYDYATGIPELEERSYYQEFKSKGGQLSIMGGPPKGSAPANHPLQELIDALTDIGIDLEDEDEEAIAGLRSDLDDVFPDLNKANHVVGEFEQDWLDGISDKTGKKEIAAAFTKYKAAVKGKYKSGGSMNSKYWIQASIKHPGILRKKAKQMGLIKGDHEILSKADLDKLAALGGVWKKRANEAKTLMGLHS